MPAGLAEPAGHSVPADHADAPDCAELAAYAVPAVPADHADLAVPVDRADPADYAEPADQAELADCAVPADHAEHAVPADQGEKFPLQVQRFLAVDSQTEVSQQMLSWQQTVQQLVAWQVAKAAAAGRQPPIALTKAVADALPTEVEAYAQVLHALAQLEPQDCTPHHHQEQAQGAHHLIALLRLVLAACVQGPCLYLQPHASAWRLPQHGGVAQGANVLAP